MTTDPIDTAEQLLDRLYDLHARDLHVHAAIVGRLIATHPDIADGILTELESRSRTMEDAR